MKRIGILTAGGDCPGLNAVIRSFTKSALHEGLEVMGIRDGFQGLLTNEITPLQHNDVSSILTRGGTILGSHNKCNPASLARRLDNGEVVWENHMDTCLKTIEQRGIDALVVIGGDGSMSIASEFVKLDIPCIGVPKTIDNDLVGTDITFGFATAVSVATDALDRVHTTAASHHRVMLVETMGRNAGWIALHSGVASGADIILVPEIPYQLDSICNAIESRRKNGRGYTIIAVGEGARAKDGEQVIAKLDPTSPDPVRLGGVASKLAKEIEDEMDIESRATVLGYVQRGGTPVPQDRTLGTLFGHNALELIKERAFNQLVVQQQGKLTQVPITSVANKQRTIPSDEPLLNSARALGTCFGD